MKGSQMSHNCFDEVPVSGRKGRGNGHSPLGYPLEDVNLCLDSVSCPLRGSSETQKARFPYLAEAVDEVRTGPEEPYRSLLMIPWRQDLLCNWAAPMCIHGAIHGAHRTQFHHRKASFYILTDRSVGVASACILRSLTNQGKGLLTKQSPVSPSPITLFPWLPS